MGSVMAPWNRRVCWSRFKAVDCESSPLSQPEKEGLSEDLGQTAVAVYTAQRPFLGEDSGSRAEHMWCESSLQEPWFPPPPPSDGQPGGPPPRSPGLATLTEQQVASRRSEKETTPPPSPRLWRGLAIHEGQRVSWQREEVAQAPGARVPGPPEKEQV